jgi:hypothetical protein
LKAPNKPKDELSWVIKKVGLDLSIKLEVSKV